VTVTVTVTVTPALWRRLVYVPPGSRSAETQSSPSTVTVTVTEYPSDATFIVTVTDYLF
jgi:hypothetical protein